jgi:hypothetical protein
MFDIKFNVMKNTIMNNEFKQLRKITENRNGPVVSAAQLPLLNTGTIAASFHTAGKHCSVRLKLNTCLRIGIKITEQPFMTNPGTSSSPTHLGGFSLLMTLHTSASEIGARDKISEDCKRGGMSIGQWLS